MAHRLHFAATQQFSRFRSEADIQRAALTFGRFSIGAPTLSQRHNSLADLAAITRRTRADRFGDEALGKVPVVFLDHSGVGVPEVARDD